MRAPLRCAVAALGLLCLQAASVPKLKPPVPLDKLPPGSFNGSKADVLDVGKRVIPGGPAVSVPLNPLYPPVNWAAGTGNWGPILPWSDPRIGKQVPGCAPEQVHLSWYDTQDSGPSVLISWATCDSAYNWQGAAANTASPPLSTADATSRVWVGLTPGVYEKGFDGTAFSYTVDNTKLLNGNPAGGGTYVSPILHHTLVTGLVPGLTYFYKIDNAPQQAGGMVEGDPFFGSFKVPGGGFPTRIGIGADAGEVVNVTASIDYSVQAKPDLFMLIGDWTYADQYQLQAASCFTPAQCAYLNSVSVSTFSPRWDAMARLLQPLASKVPFLGAVGNHEVEATPPNAATPSSSNAWSNTQFFTRFSNYLSRYPNPTTAAIARNGPTPADLAATTPTDANQGRGLYYVSELPGVATIVTLSTYNYGETFTASDPQYIWLKGVLAKVDRVKTPWLIVQMHSGIYTTADHWLEVECMRQLYEPLFRVYTVDLVFNGHTHDYERDGPVYNYQIDEECGPSYMTVGSYGTNEGVTTWWIDQWATGGVASGYYLFDSCPPAQPSAYSPLSDAVTAPGQWGVGGSCVPPKIQASGDWCPSTQPPYSRWREHAYGVGMLDLLSPAKAVWAFYSQESAMFKPVDEVVFTRADPVKCAATPETIAAAAATGVSLDAVVSKFNVTAAALAKLASVKAGNKTLGLRVDPKGAAAGIARSASDYVQAKLALSNHTIIAVKAGGVGNKSAGATFTAFGR